MVECCCCSSTVHHSIVFSLLKLHLQLVFYYYCYFSLLLHEISLYFLPLLSIPPIKFPHFRSNSAERKKNNNFHRRFHFDHHHHIRHHHSHFPIPFELR